MIAAQLSCPSCHKKYAISFWMKGLVPCLSFVCSGCRNRYKMTPPEVEEALCHKCTRRVDCLVDPPFIVHAFFVNHEPLQKWEVSGDYSNVNEALIDEVKVLEINETKT
jgi:hypothetical protein